VLPLTKTLCFRRPDLCTGALSFSTTGVFRKPCPAGNSRLVAHVNQFASVAAGCGYRIAGDKPL